MLNHEQETARYDQPEPWENDDEIPWEDDAEVAESQPDIWDLADQARAEFKENPDNWAGRK